MFIVLEGINSSRLASALNKKIPNSIVLRENTDFVAEMEKNPEKAIEIFESFSKERVEFGNKIKEYLDLGKTVILDRYFHSSICYQIELCKEMGFDCKGLVKVYQKYSSKWLKPDLVLINTELEEDMEDIVLRKIKRCYDSLGDLLDNIYYIKDEKDALELLKKV